MTDIHTPSPPVRPSGDISPLQLGNAAKQPGGRWTSVTNWLDDTRVRELADGTWDHKPSDTEINRMARELLYWHALERAEEPLIGPCIEWQGSRRGSMGYGQVGTRKYGTRVAHRVEWIKHHGPIPPGKQVCHRCDNPPCVNIDHLFLGTTRVNAIDRAVKGRSPHNTNGNERKTHCPRGHEYDVLRRRDDGGMKRGCTKCEKERRSARRHREEQREEGAA